MLCTSSPSIASNHDPFSHVAHFVLCRYLLPKNTHLAEAAAVGGWAGGRWELELNHMCATRRGSCRTRARARLTRFRWGRVVALSVYSGDLAATDELQQELLLEL